MHSSQTFSKVASDLAEIGRDFYRKGWVLGTSGNFSAVLSRDPVCIAITSSSIDKGLLNADHILKVDEQGQVLEGIGRPSAETLLHLSVVRLRQAGSVLHTHSVWSNILSDAHAERRGLSIEGYEMLKGLEGVVTHEHQEWLPIIENSQDMPSLAKDVEKVLVEHPKAHGFLLRRHGMYTWGKDIAEAKRHVEILEFLLEVRGRSEG